jgi:hypothetical protein
MEKIYKKGGGYYAESGRFICRHEIQIDLTRYEIESYNDLTIALLRAKASKKSEAKNKKIGDTVLDITTAAGTFQANEYSKAKILASSARAERIGAGFSVDWLDVNNVQVTLDQAKIFELADAIIDRDTAAALACNLQKAEIEALTTYAEVIAYTV